MEAVKEWMMVKLNLRQAASNLAVISKPFTASDAAAILASTLRGAGIILTTLAEEGIVERSRKKYYPGATAEARKAAYTAVNHAGGQSFTAFSLANPKYEYIVTRPPPGVGCLEYSIILNRELRSVRAPVDPRRVLLVACF